MAKAKRKTRKQKRKIQDTLQYRWGLSEDSGSLGTSVKREMNKGASKTSHKTKSIKNPVSSEDSAHTASIKRDIAKTLLFASMIFLLELVIYWFR